jgi:HK97 family phage major capsid protein
MANIHEIVEMRRERANLAAQMKDILDRSTNEKRELHADEEVQLDKIIADETELRKKIARLEAAEDIQKSLEGNENRYKADQREQGQKPEYRQVFKKWVQGGTQVLNEEERGILFNNVDPEARAQSSITGSAGGYTVPQGFYDQIIEAMKWYGGMRNVSFVFPTATGNGLPIPTSNDTNNIGELVGENVQVGSQDVTFGQANLGAYKFSSKMVLVPIELLQDSEFDIESFLAKKLGERIGRAQNSYFTTGTGINQPQGIVTGATLGKTGATGQVASVTYDDLIDLEHSVDKAYRRWS